MGVCSAKRPLSNLNNVTSTLNLQQQADNISSNIPYKPSSYDVKEVYNVDPQIIGQGHFGTVRKAIRKLAEPRNYAVKTIIKEKLGDKLNLLQREVRVLSMLDHPNIIRFYGSFENSKYFHIIMEYADGGELLDRIVKTNSIKEEQAKEFIRQICGCVYFLHENGICHRDLKPDNFLFSGNDLKMTDFGLSRKFYNNNENDKYDIFTSSGQTALKSIVGTPLYVAPEILKGNYDQRCDLWSIGVLSYILLSEQPPFVGQTTKEIYRKIQTQEYNFNQDIWKQVSKEGKDFIAKLLVVDVKKRMTLEQAFEHPWIAPNKNLKQQKQLNNIELFNLLNILKSYKNLKKDLIWLVINFVNEKDIQQELEFLRSWDVSNKGLFSINDIIQMFSKSNKETEDAKQLAGSDLDIKISFSYIIGALLESQKKIPAYSLYSCFFFIDLRKKKIITEDDLDEYMRMTYRQQTNEQIKEMIKEYDVDGDGKLNWNEFMRIFGVQLDYEQVVKSLN